MKKLFAPGCTLIQSQPPLKFKRPTFDPWRSHAFIILDVTAINCPSGIYLGYFSAYLTDYTEWFYCVRFLSDYNRAIAWVYEFEDFIAPVQIRGAYGEWFNYVCRPMVFAKLDGQGFIDYVNSH